MQDVYRNALFSISALGAKDDQDGCFFERDPLKAAPITVSFKLTEDGEQKAFISELEEGKSWHLHFNDEPLVQRSWVVQERLLAPRTLHFGSKQVFWECREASCCESHPQGVPVDPFKQDGDGDYHFMKVWCRNPNHPFLWKQLLDAPDRRRARDPYEELFLDWNMLIEYYASRELTVPNDKLVALSGLANSMKARLQQLRPGLHRYLAGHWEENLMDTLVWSVKEPARRALQYRAPSWSWASLDGHLDLNGTKGMEMVSLASIVSVEMTHPGKEDAGEVDGGILILKGPCALAKLDLEGPDLFGPGNLILHSEDGSSLDSMDEVKVVDIALDTLHDLTEEVLLIWVCAKSYDFVGYWGGGVLTCNLIVLVVIGVAMAWHLPMWKRVNTAGWAG